MILLSTSLLTRKRLEPDSVAESCAGALLTLRDSPDVTEVATTRDSHSVTDDEDSEESQHEESQARKRAADTSHLPPSETFGKALKKPRTLLKFPPAPRMTRTHPPKLRKQISSIQTPGSSIRAPVTPLRAAPRLPFFVGSGKVKPLDQTQA